MVKINIDTADLVTPLDAANQLGIGYATLYRRLRRNEIICVKLAGRTFIPKSEVERAKKLEAMRRVAE